MPWFHCLPKESNHQDILPFIVLLSTKRKNVKMCFKQRTEQSCLGQKPAFSIVYQMY